MAKSDKTFTFKNKADKTITTGSESAAFEMRLDPRFTEVKQSQPETTRVMRHGSDEPLKTFTTPADKPANDK